MIRFSNSERSTTYTKHGNLSQEHKMDPFGEHTSSQPLEVVRASKNCQDGAEIILKRIFKKLFNQINELQPSELDDEFVYQSAISYDDYLAMVKQMRDDDQSNCASLNRIENILSTFMSSAVVKRPMHTSLFSNLWFSSGSLTPPMTPLSNYYGPNTGPTLHLHLLLVLFIVGLAAWFFRHVAGINAWKSLPLSMLLVGFVEFCMHKNELNMNHRLNLERCRNPSWIARITSMVGYDYDSCQADTANAASSKPNIAFIGVEYLFELIFIPMVQFGDTMGKSLQSYLNRFTGFNYFLAPIFPIILVAATFIGFPFIMYLIARRQSVSVGNERRALAPSANAKAIQSPKKSRSNNYNHR